MNRSRKKVVTTLFVGCVIAVALSLLFLRPSHSDIRLTVVGYTNDPLTVVNEIDARRVIVVLTNCGANPIRTAHLLDAHPELQGPLTIAGYRLALSYVKGRPLELAPGAATSVVTHLPNKESEGRLRIAYTQLDWRTKLTENLQNSRHTILRNIASNLFPTELHWTQSDPITNPPSPYGPIVLPPPSSKER